MTDPRAVVWVGRADVLCGTRNTTFCGSDCALHHPCFCGEEAVVADDCRYLLGVLASIIVGVQWADMIWQARTRTTTIRATVLILLWYGFWMAIASSEKVMKLTSWRIDKELIRWVYLKLPCLQLVRWLQPLKLLAIYRRLKASIDWACTILKLHTVCLAHGRRITKLIHHSASSNLSTVIKLVPVLLLRVVSCSI